jgi:cysteine desulfurase / selenocysteine lyase
MARAGERQQLEVAHADDVSLAHAHIAGPVGDVSRRSRRRDQAAPTRHVGGAVVRLEHVADCGSSLGGRLKVVAGHSAGGQRADDRGAGRARGRGGGTRSGEPRNIVPWQQRCQQTGARLCVAPVDDRGQVMLDEFERLLSDRTRIVAFSHVSNVLGAVTPAREMTELAHRYGARVLIDGAQAVSHMPVDVQLLDSDWYAFSGHKVFGPTGIGVLHGKRDLLNAMPPWQGGGSMIRDVSFEHTEYQTAPERFEAGTASIADAVGLGAALEYMEQLGRENIARHEHELLNYATATLHTLPGLELIGTAPEKAAVLSFVLYGLSPEEVGAELDRDGIAVRAGHHCAQPTVRRFGHEGTIRASLALYNTRADVDALIAALRRVATRSVELPNPAHPRSGSR